MRQEYRFHLNVQADTGRYHEERLDLNIQPPPCENKNSLHVPVVIFSHRGFCARPRIPFFRQLQMAASMQGKISY